MTAFSYKLAEKNIVKKIKTAHLERFISVLDLQLKSHLRHFGHVWRHARAIACHTRESLFSILPFFDTTSYTILWSTKDCSFMFVSSIYSFLENPDSH